MQAWRTVASVPVPGGARSGSATMAAQGAQIVLGAVAFGKPKPTTRDVSPAPFFVPLPLAGP